jgi:glycosyltransferase involved in cell wall biosynthesis
VIPALDVVVPTLNAASTLARTLAALRAAESRLGLAVTVCDGGSRDDTVTIARQGAAAGRAPWLLFLHADTLPAAGWAEAVTGFVSRPENAGRAAFFRLRFESDDSRARRVERLAAWRSRRLGLPYGDQGLLIARSFYAELGGFRPLPLMEDVDLARRIGRRRLVPLDCDVVTSAQRYQRDGWLVRPVRNLSCLALFFAGVSPALLTRLYGR